MRRRTALRIICWALIIWGTGGVTTAVEPKRVVLLFDERPVLPGLAALETNLVGILTSNFSDTLEVYHEAMDLSRFGSSAYKIRLRDFLASKYADKKIDVVVAVMGPALDFLLAHGEEIFPGVPIVFCGVDRREISDRLLPPHVSGVLLKRKFKPTVELALHLHPDTQQIVVISGTSEFDMRILADAKEEFRQYENRVEFTYLTVNAGVILHQWVGAILHQS